MAKKEKKEKKKRKERKVSPQKSTVAPSKHISAKEVRYMNQPTKSTTTVTQERSEKFDKQLAASTNKLMFNLRVMLCLYVVLLIFNLAAPLYVSMDMAYHSFFQIAICVVHSYNILSAWGWFKHRFAVVWWILIRAAEAIYYIFIRSDLISWYVYALLLVGDILFLVIFSYDNRIYEEVDKPIV